MTTKQRKYSLGDAEMLITASTIIESAIANKAFLQGKRSSWQDPFFDTIKGRIDTSIQTYLGIDNAKDLRQATQALKLIQKQALSDLAEAKIQFAEDFKTNKVKRDEILMQLGFTNYHKSAQAGSHEALINLLFQFKMNLTAPLKTELVSKGTAEQLLTTITSYADTLKNANVTQETNKGARKVITAAAITEFNDIYAQVISISKIAGNFYKDKLAIKEQFSYSKVANALKSKGKTAVPPPVAKPIKPAQGDKPSN
jgi:hypothetical protein